MDGGPALTATSATGTLQRREVFQCWRAVSGPRMGRRGRRLDRGRRAVRDPAQSAGSPRRPV